MLYASGRQIELGDDVFADGMTGTIVCDFDNRRFAEGYEGWDAPDTELVGGGRLSSGVLVYTDEAGLIHYYSGTPGLELRLPARDQRDDR